MEQIDSSTSEDMTEHLRLMGIETKTPHERFIQRVLDPLDDMDHERIRIEDFIVNIKKSYKTIIRFDYSPEQFFGIAREKNRKIE